MQRSPSQILFQFLPGAVFSHEEGFIAQVDSVETGHADVNDHAVLAAVGAAFEQWDPDQLHAPDPRRQPNEYVLLVPRQVRFDVYPLTFVCKNGACGRVRVFRQQRDVVAALDANGRLICTGCSSRLRQLRYVTAHECGRMDPMFVQICGNCNNRDNMYLDDVGSFASSMWRCRACGYSRGTRFTPCGCNKYPGASGQSYQRGFTERDSRLWCPQILTLLNIRSSVFDDLQRSDGNRGLVSVASWLGDEQSVATSLQTLAASTGSSQRKTQAEWDAQAAALRASGVDEDIIESMRLQHGPVTTGVGAITSQLTPLALELAATPGFVERAGLFDSSIITDRESLTAIAAATPPGPAQRSMNEATAARDQLGIEEISVTQRFPILMASFGYQRGRRDPGGADLVMYQKQRHYDNKNAIFTVPAETEALVVTVDAVKIIGYLQHIGLWAGAVPSDQRQARLELLEVLAADPDVGTATAAGVTRRLVHTMSHALLRALDDGQTGFGESSLAEWIVPDALTFAVYVAAYNAFTLGAFDTVIRRRVSSWLELALDSVQTCDNDPMCNQTSGQKPHAACDRCLHTSFGCRTWNADLDRKLLRQFWKWTSA